MAGRGDTGRLTPEAVPDLFVGLFVLVLGLLCLWQAWAIPVTPIYAQVGPKFVPYLVGMLVVAVGGGLTAAALRGGWSRDLEEVQEAPPVNWRALGLLGVGLLANLVLIDSLGFVFAATAQFVLVAAAFGSRHPLRDLGIGVAVTLGAYLAFDKLLGVNIGAGILEGIL
ncbi:tripartite tricarboxylate transporter TctB family protein [Roseomonas sp. GC11]|uniref:tripartite tricarboxylate transporter TctB family protein n=1 Tax=Roseomonas sp. GC11 TaxID=2950546 RepID=UPI00210F133E|nr:tripartite tricarboxylate transporter TctB family protein [Roseomonas sp. GC11]MCQ4160732.1 tripartite tricarboxylate transporter TctB family protein [Roseomonas sp. GC11]